MRITVLFFALYSVLRKQSCNVKVYAPRLVAEGRARLRGRFSIETLLPSAGWVRRAWQPTEEDLYNSCGLDGVVFSRIFVFSLRVFSLAAIIGIFVLLPTGMVGGNELHEKLHVCSHLLDVSNQTPMEFVGRLWCHFSAAYIITGVMCYLLYAEYKYIAEKRIAYFNASKPQPQHFTVLVRDIPLHAGNSLSDTVEAFFTEYHPSDYLLFNFLVDALDDVRLPKSLCTVYRKLTHLKSTSSSSQNQNRSGFFGMFGKRVDLVRDYSKKLEDIEQNVRLVQSDSRRELKFFPAAFVSFKSRYGAAKALHIQQSVNPTEWVTEWAPEPRDVYWPFFSTSFMQRWISKLIVFVASVLLVILFLLVVAFVQSLTYLEELEALFPFLGKILKITVISQVVTGYLPSLILHLVAALVPPIVKLFSAMQGYVAVSQIEKSACKKMLLFTIWFLFFANVLTGSVTSEIEFLFDPKTIPSRLAVAVPAQVHICLHQVLINDIENFKINLLHFSLLMCDFISRHCCRRKDDKFEIPSIPYYSEIPRILLFVLLGLTYFLLAPMILPFILVFFCIGYIIYRNQLLDVYQPKYDTGGRFWPVVHNSTIFSLVLMHIIAVGIFGVKKLPVAAILIVPLPVLTLLFNDYCRKRFLPVFRKFSAEVCSYFARSIAFFYVCSCSMPHMVRFLFPLKRSERASNGSRTKKNPGFALLCGM
ncbi:hypothetical protein ZIOFF_016733 [Zingiber officinale]|uniref:Uncharacterized protein n=1 Tax=Zingiber officinale TaxID=94328 RepID=A0A8J5I2Y7_ZINOF|nr:hypothetical protein ZIOFF_016733 [Zingiber officinale]